jgi:fructose-specific phosphotransferase system IIC component
VVVVVVVVVAVKVGVSIAERPRLAHCILRGGLVVAEDQSHSLLSGTIAGG